MPRLLARRIDRLSRHAHAFHRFAHHPLCGRYESELVALRGRTRLCRGCLLAVSGAVGGLALGLALPGLGAWSLDVALVASFGLLAPVRLGKLWTRFLPATALAAAFGAGLRGPFALGIALSGVSAGCAAALLWAYRRRGPNREACATCPELSPTIPCSGVQPILRREAAFRRLTGRWLDSMPSASRASRAASAAPAAP